MPADNLQSYKLVNQEASSSTKQNNMIQSIEDGLNSIEDANVSASAAIDLSKLASISFLTFTPSWTSGGTAPSLGNGTIAGRYVKIGRLVVFRIGLTMGSSTTYGTGQYRFSLPVGPADNAFMGGAWAVDASPSNSYALMPRVPEPTQTYLTLMTMASPAAIVDNTVPITWASGDILRISGMYESSA